MSDLQMIVVMIITGLGALAFFMIKHWTKSWDSKFISHDKRISKHDVEIATLAANMEHIKETTDETRKDIKEFLSKSDGARSAG